MIDTINLMIEHELLHEDVYGNLVSPYIENTDVREEATKVSEAINARFNAERAHADRMAFALQYILMQRPTYHIELMARETLAEHEELRSCK